MSTSRCHHPMPLSQIVDAELRRYNGELLGVIDELLVDLRTGRIAYLLAIDARGQRLRFRWDAVAVRNGSFVLHGAEPWLITDADGEPGSA
ncbi:MAG: PRC-barrel domain-containing protein [Pseudomonadales bacterium]